MKLIPLISAIGILTILAVALFGCGTQPYILQKEAFVPSELKGDKSISIRLFSDPRILIYDDEPVENLRRYLAETLRNSLLNLNMFSDVKILLDRDAVRTDLVFEGEFTVVDERRSESILGDILGRRRDPYTGISLDPTVQPLLGVKCRIVNAKHGSIVYAPKEIKVVGYRCVSCPSIETIMRRLIDEVVNRLTEDLKMELALLNRFLQSPNLASDSFNSILTNLIRC